MFKSSRCARRKGSAIVYREIRFSRLVVKELGHARFALDALGDIVVVFVVDDIVVVV